MGETTETACQTHVSLASAYEAAFRRHSVARDHHHAMIREGEPLRIRANMALREFERSPDETAARAYREAKAKLEFAEGRMVAASEAAKLAFATLDAARKPHYAAKRLREAAETLRACGVDPLHVL